MIDLSIPLKGKSLTDIFGDAELTDQHGKPFKPAELLKDGQCLVLFGYGGCPMCQKITDSVARIQQELGEKGRDVPIVVVSVQPEADREDMKTYVGSYYFKGVKQFKDEKLPADPDAARDMGEASYDAAKNKPQAGRILHVVCPPDKEKAQALQKRIGLMINPTDDKQHSSFITLFDKGAAVKAYRGLPGSGDAAAKYHAELAGTVAADIAAAQTVKTPDPLKTADTTTSVKQSAAAIWNFTAPVFAGMAGGLAMGGGSFSFAAIIAGLASAVVASFVTQYATSCGVFSGNQPAVTPGTPGGTTVVSADTPIKHANHTKAQAEADTIKIADYLAAMQTSGKPAAELPVLKAAHSRG